MKKYWVIMKTAFIGSLFHRFHYLFMFLTNISYIILTYFLWKAIYGHSNLLNGMDFNQAFVYLAMSSSVFFLFQTWIEWDFSRGVITGNIIMDLIKPVDLQWKELFRIGGFTICKFLTIGLPTILLLFFVFQTRYQMANVPFFLLTLLFAFLINFHIDYITGLIAFNTQSVWGLSTAKEIIVLLLSGAMIPLNFYPEILAKILTYLPFQAIYNIPMTILTTREFSPAVFWRALIIQAIWVLILIGVSKIIYQKAIKVAIINGG